MFNQDDGSTMEKGRMVNPESGAEEDYEEVWEDMTITNVPETGAGGVLEMKDDANDTRGLVILMGEYCQGIMRDGSRIFVERWVYMKNSREWMSVAATQALALPCRAAIDKRWWRKGETMDYNGMLWTVVEVGR